MDRRRTSLIPVWLLFVAFCIAAAPGPSPGTIDHEEYRARRMALAGILRAELPPGGSGILILDSAPEPENALYRQESNLYYLSGTEIPGSALVLFFDRPAEASGRGSDAGEGRYAEYLYLPERDPRRERFTGVRVGAGGLEPEALQPDQERRKAMAVTGFDRIPDRDFPPGEYLRSPVQRRSDLAKHLDRFLPGAEVLFHAARPGSLGAPVTPDLDFLRRVRERYPLLALRDPGPALERMRRVKSPAEVELLRQAIEITCRAYRDALRQARPGMAEYQVQAVVEYRFTAEGARHPAFPSIVGSGPNSCIFHYDANDRILEEGDILLLDAGAEYRRYSADVTRTFPAGGRFTGEQRKAYEVVLKALKAAIAVIRPGVPFSEIDRTARKVITEAGYDTSIHHRMSHHIGLDVHEGGEPSGPLEEGMVLAVEPGIYIPEKEIGVRIEDDVLVTAEGAQILSDCVPREADAVEMQRAEGLKSGGR